MKLNKEQYDIFKKLSSKRKTPFWSDELPLASDRAKYILSTPELSEQLIKEIRESRRRG
jgi:hypothetical protein